MRDRQEEAERKRKRDTETGQPERAQDGEQEDDKIKGFFSLSLDSFCILSVVSVSHFF